MTRTRTHARGFTLLELVVSIAIGAVVVAFAGMFISAPLDAYDLQTRRADLLDSVSTAWPLMEPDLRRSLPNSLRTRRNGNVVALEMLAVVDGVRYKSAPGAAFNTGGVFRGIAHPFVSNSFYLSVNNLGTPGADAYALANTITPAGATISIVSGGPGEDVVTVAPPAVFTGVSADERIYLVSGPVTFLCDENAGTLRRYSGYSIAANHAARDSAGELNGAGAANTLLAQGIASCAFDVSAPGAAQPQTVSVRLGAAANGDSIALLQQAHGEFAP